MDWVYVCASKYLIFNFVGSKMAESALGVADLPAWDNIGCREGNLSLFEAFFDLWIGFMFAHQNISFLTLSDRKWLKPMEVWQICLLGIILDASSAIFHLFEAFFDLWITFMFAHRNF